MTRRIITIGKSSHAITLPHRFVKAHNLQAGDHIHVVEHADSITLHPTKQERKTTTHLKGVHEMDGSGAFLKRFLQALFLSGAQGVCIEHVDNKTQQRLREIFEESQQFYEERVDETTMHIICPVGIPNEQALDKLTRRIIQRTQNIYSDLSKHPNTNNTYSTNTTLV